MRNGWCKRDLRQHNESFISSKPCRGSLGLNRPSASLSGRHYRSRSAIKLRGKSSQTQANYTEMDEPAKIGNESHDGEDEQAQQESQKPIALRRSRGLQKDPTT